MFSYEFEPDFKAGELLGSEGPASILAAAGPVPIGDHIWHRRGKDIAICATALATDAGIEEHAALVQADKELDAGPPLRGLCLRPGRRSRPPCTPYLL